MAKGLTPRAEDYSQWYNDIVKRAGLAEHSDVRGCMVIKPYGYAIWERMKEELDRMFKETGHENAYFPLFIPKSYLSKEASHVEGFAKECAVVTHYRLKSDPDGSGVVVDPEAKLDEELIVRPTSETIIWNSYKKWIQSYRDLPILINQWANVVRWEMRTRLFLRTAEFLWQEGHTAHSTREEAEEEARRMLNIYAEFAEDWLAMPVLKGVKSESERFAGALDTYCVEALMQDGKALQLGTSHFLGQNFARAFDVKFTTRDGGLDYVWATSWGVTTRMIGALVMTHSDDHGLVLPPKLAPIQVVIVPIYRNDEEYRKVCSSASLLAGSIRKSGIRVKLDDRDTQKPGWKFAEYEFKGVPLRIAIGPRDIENNTLEISRRDLMTKATVPADGIVAQLPRMLEDIQKSLYARAAAFRAAHTIDVDDYEHFKKALDAGGFVRAHWDGSAETEEKIRDETKASIRCIALDGESEKGRCILTGKPSNGRVVFAKAY